MAKSKCLAAASDEMDVYIKLTTGRVVPLKVRPSTTVSKLCQELRGHETSVQPSRLALKYQGKLLDKSKTVGEYGVTKETVLRVDVLPSRSLSIFIKNADGKVIPLTVESTNTVSQLKDMVNDKEDIPTTRQKLFVGDRELRSALSSLEEAGIENETVVRLEVREPDAACASAAAATVSGPSMNDSEKEDVLASFAASVGASSVVDVVFSFDTTGSMYSCLSQVRQQLRNTVTRLLQDIPNIRIGVIAHGDYCDQDSSYVIRELDLTNDTTAIVNFVRDVPSSGGGDSPECYEWALLRAQRLSWRDDSAKAFVVIGDALPHPASYTDQDIAWRDELSRLTDMSVKVYGVQAMNLSESTPFYRELAHFSGGKYLTFAHFSLITDMFLAVCYRESCPEQLQAYQLEVETEGRMTDELGEVFKELQKETEEPRKEKKEKKDSKSSEDDNDSPNMVHQPWWSRRFDHSSSPQYFYNTKTDRWSNSRSRTLSLPAKKSTHSSSVSFTSPSISSSSHSTAATSSSRRRSLSLRSKKKKRSRPGAAAASSGEEIKIAILGTGGVGKSSLTIQYVTQMFVDEYDPTIEDSYRKAIVFNDKPYLLDILDTAGSDEFTCMHDIYIRDAHAVLVVYSTVDRSTLDEVQRAVSQIRRGRDDEATPIVLVGNKTDLKDDRQVTTEEGEALAKELNLSGFVETTAKSFESTAAAFNKLLSVVEEQRSSTASSHRRPNRSCTIM